MPALYAPPQKRRRTHPSSLVSGVYVDHCRREPQASRATSLADSSDAISRISDRSNDSVAADDDEPCTPRISLDDFLMDNEPLAELELLPGVTFEEAEIDMLLRSLSPAPPSDAPLLPSLSTSQVELPTQCALEMATVPAQTTDSLVSLPSPEQRMPAFYEVGEDVQMEEFGVPLPSPLQFSAVGSPSEQSSMQPLADCEHAVDPPEVTPLPLSPSELVIAAQPGPKSYLKASAEPPVFVVSLRLTEPAFSVSAVRIRGTANTLGDNPPQLLNSAGEARFTVAFSNAPALRVTRVFFEVDIHTQSGGRQTLTSAHSYPFIVRTNISQFLRAERLVFMDLLHAQHQLDDWSPENVAASLERHFSAWAGERTLHPDDVSFLRTKLGAERPSPQSVEEAWDEWYGPMVKNFTDKNFRKLWDKRVIFGFATRAHTTLALQELARRIGQDAVGVALAGFMEDSPLLTLAHLCGDGTVEFRRLSTHEIKQPFRDILTQSAPITTLLVRDAEGGLQVRPKAELVALLLPKKMREQTQKLG